MARQIKSEMPGAKDARAIIVPAQAMCSAALAATFHRLGRGLGRLWHRTGAQARPAH